MKLTRRDALKLSAFAGAAVALPVERTFGAPAYLTNRMAASALPAPFSMPFSTPYNHLPIRSDATTDYYSVSMEPGMHEFLPGVRTPIWGYDGRFPGPTFNVQQGRKIVVRHTNNLPPSHPVLNYTPWTSVHLHGSASLPPSDGYASDITNPGQWKDYYYPNWQPARTLWYHDHGLHHTAENVYMGLAGAYVMTDAREQALPIPHGDFDVPLIVSDRMFNADGSLLFSTGDGAGFYGDVITVNGAAWPVMKVLQRKYRFRILNASLSRSYAWSLSDGSPLTVIGTDAGLMPTPQVVKSFRHGVSERYEVVIDFAKIKPGTRVVLRNTSPKNNVNYANTDKVMAFDVVRGAFPTADNAVPSQLFPGQPTMALPESQAVRTRKFELKRANGQWTINGETWDDVVKSGFTKTLADPRRDDVEIWEISNPSGGWHHPFHIHFIDFRILTRNGVPAMPHERGAKDVVFVGENETVRVLVKFDQGDGYYMMHCHNLVHEDHDMMGQFLIRNDAAESPHPLSNPAQWLPEDYPL